MIVLLMRCIFFARVETHALRGLMLDSLGRREEALENIRKGLRFDLNSHVCKTILKMID